jgi:predicted PurR-regulated permease PerM
MRKTTLRVLVLLSVLIIFPLIVYAEEKKELQEIRERLIRIEERMVTKDELKTEINDVRSGLKTEINNLRSELKTEINNVRSELKTEINNLRSELKGFMLWGFGITFGGIFALIGFVLWDRRTAIAPAIRKNKELEEREEKIEKVLKEVAQKDQNVAEALKHVGLL